MERPWSSLPSPSLYFTASTVIMYCWFYNIYLQLFFIFYFHVLAEWMCPSTNLKRSIYFINLRKHLYMYVLFLSVLFVCIYWHVVLTFILTLFYLLNKMHKERVGTFQLLKRKNACAYKVRFTILCESWCVLRSNKKGYW